MEKYLIEVPHGGDKASCAQAVKVFLAWLIVEVEDKHAAERILPTF